MNNDSININNLLSMLSKMDKSQLECGMQQLQKIINSKDENKN